MQINKPFSLEKIVDEVYLDAFPKYQTGNFLFEKREHSSVVEHSTADREVSGSNPDAPCVYCREHYFPLQFTQMLSERKQKEAF